MGVYRWWGWEREASGDEAMLFCAADGIPKPIIKWYRGEMEVRSTGPIDGVGGSIRDPIDRGV